MQGAHISVEINGGKRQQTEAKRLPFISLYFLLFPQIGLFQWVTAEGNEKSFPPVLISADMLPAHGLYAIRFINRFVVMADPDGSALIRWIEIHIARVQVFEKGLAQNFFAAADSRITVTLYSIPN